MTNPIEETNEKDQDETAQLDFQPDLIFTIINSIFHKDAPKATLKVGLIYLAKIIHFYPEFSETYLDILLNVPEQIRTSVVDVNPIPGTEED